MEKEDFERAIKSAEKQSMHLRIEQEALRSALEEIKRISDSREVDGALHDELYQRYSQQLDDVNERAEQYRRITQSIRHITKYEKEIELLKISKNEFIERLEKIENKFEEEKSQVMELADKFGIIVTPRAAPKTPPPTTTERPREVERPIISTPSPKEVTEAESEIERLRKEILNELEKARSQTKK